MRKMEVAPGPDGYNRLVLNDEPLFQFGPLDQGFWPGGLYTAPSDEALRYDVGDDQENGLQHGPKAREGRAGPLVLLVR